MVLNPSGILGLLLLTFTVSAHALGYTGRELDIALYSLSCGFIIGPILNRVVEEL